MENLIKFIGGFLIVMGALDLLNHEEGEKFELKPILAKIIGGVAVVGIAYLLKYYNIDIDL